MRDKRQPIDRGFEITGTGEHVKLRCPESIQFVGVTHGWVKSNFEVSNFIRFIASLPSGIRRREKKKWKTLGLTYSYTVLSEKLDGKRMYKRRTSPMEREVVCSLINND